MSKYAIIGTGAIGGYLAAKLTKANYDVHCLLRTEYKQIKENGLTLISEKSEFNVKINSYSNATDMPKCDIIIVTLKTFDNFILNDIIDKIAHPNTTVILLQNGIGMEQELEKFILPSNIIGSSTSLKVSRLSPGVIRHIGFNTIDLAIYCPDQDENQLQVFKQIISNFESIGLKCIKYENLISLRWKKLTVNIPGNGLQIILNASMQEIIKNQYSYKLLCDLTKEVIFAAEKCGAKLPENYYQFRLKTFDDTLMVPTFYNSMKEDYDLNKKLELHSIYENAIKIGKQYSVEMPLTEFIYTQLLYLSEKT